MAAEDAVDFTPEWDAQFATTGHYDAFCAMHSTAVYRIARRYVRQEEDAEEVVADAFTRAYLTYTAHQTARSPLPQPLVPFLYRTAHNRAIDLYRAQRRSAQVPLPDDAAAAAAGGVADTDAERELLAVVRTCIAALPSPYREVYARYYLEELVLDEVAASVGLPYERVRGVLKSARERLGRSLTPHLLAEALAELSAADRALLAPYYHTGRRGVDSGRTDEAAFAPARLRLVRRLLRWEVLFQRHPPEEYCALAALAQHRDPARVAAAVTALRRERGVPGACTIEEAAALADRALTRLDRRLRGQAR